MRVKDFNIIQKMAITPNNAYLKGFTRERVEYMDA